MRRRDFLATAGTLLSAGCGGLLGGNNKKKRSGPPARLYEGGPGAGIESGIDSNVGPVSVNVSDIDTDINVSSIDTNISDFDTNIDTNIDVGIGNDGTATPANDEAARLVRQATSKLNEAISTYTSFAGEDAGLMDVDPTTMDFQQVHIRSLVEEAMRLLGQAVSSATEGQLANIAALEQVGVFIVNAAAAQYSLVQAYDRLLFATERLYGESLVQVELANNEMQQHRSDAADALERLEAETEAEAMRVISTLSDSLYREKVRRLDDQIEAFESFGSGLNELRNGVAAMQEAVPEYLGENYDAAANGFLDASTSFGIGATSFSLIPGAEPLEPKANEVYGVATTLQQAADDLHRSAEAWVNDNRLIFFEARRAAEAHIESNPIVRDMRTMNDIIA